MTTDVKIKESKKKDKSTGSNAMRDIIVDKVVLHICAGEFGPKLEKSKKLLGLLTNGRKPADTKAKVKLPKWGLRPGLVIGSKVTLRGTDADVLLKRTLKAKALKLNAKSFDNEGTFAFGIKEYIDVEGMKYDPQLGIFGFDVIVNLRRKGFRVKHRKLQPAIVGKNARITKKEAQDFIAKKYNVVVG